MCSVHSGMSVVARVMERNVETWIFSTIFSVCVKAFPHLGKKVSGPEPQRGGLGSAPSVSGSDSVSCAPF